VTILEAIRAEERKLEKQLGNQELDSPRTQIRGSIAPVTVQQFIERNVRGEKLPTQRDAKCCQQDACFPLYDHTERLHQAPGL
jgi:hypothetical protein